MKIKLYAEESFKTTVRRGSLEIDTDNYPEVQGMTEGEISNYIDGHAYDMKPVNPDVYSSLGEELSDQDVEYDDINFTVICIWYCIMYFFN